MRSAPVAAAFVAVAAMTPVPDARAFGGSAAELERRGTFAVTNDADFAFSQQIGHGGGTAFQLRPSLDYFVINNLSIGGAVGFTYESGSPSFTEVTLMPRVGLEFALSDSWSFWPQLSTPISLPNHGPKTVSIDVFAPFLVHPAEHFFFGIGPGFSQTLTSPSVTYVSGGFLIGGYFDH